MVDKLHKSLAQYGDNIKVLLYIYIVQYNLDYIKGIYKSRHILLSHNEHLRPF